MSNPASHSSSELERIAALIDNENLSEAKIAVDRLLERESTSAEGWWQKGAIHRAMGDFSTAIMSFNQALKHRSDFAEACFDLAQLLEATGQMEMAIKIYGHWLKILQSAPAKKPMVSGSRIVQTMETWLNKGNELLQQRDLEGAMAAYRKVLDINPDSPAALSNMGVALYHQYRIEEAEQMLFRALRIRPGHLDALNMLGGCYKDTGRMAQAIAAYRYAITINPAYRLAWLNLGKCYFDLKNNLPAIEAYEKALELSPGHVDALAELTHLLFLTCQWEKGIAVRAQLAEAIRAGASAEPFTIAVHTPDLQRKNAERWSVKLYPRAKAYDPACPLPADSRKDGKLRIGYVSSDLQRHATTALISELFEHHDRQKFEVYAYSYGKDDGGEERKRIIRAVDGFRDIWPLTDNESSAQIRQDGIDILIDLKGYTQGHRMPIMSARPAPLQMHYLGYPGSTGATFIDYFLTDPVVSPEYADAEFSESLIRLPHSYQINDRHRPFPEALPRGAYGLSREGFVFCDFNNSYKITPEIFSVWMRLLKQVPNSILWVYETDAVATEQLRYQAVAHGIEQTRIVGAAPARMSDHLARYNHVDLFLDTSPVCGHTTASDALWCGVPVVTLTGTQFISRVASSLLAAAGLPELAVDNLEAYEKLALSIATDPEKLAALKRHLIDVRPHCPLFDSVSTTRALEASYLHAAQLHRSGKKPQSFALAPDLSIA